MALSLPHFLDADPSLPENIEGLKPDRKKHESFAIIQQVNNIKYNNIQKTKYCLRHMLPNHKIKKLF